MSDAHAISSTQPKMGRAFTGVVRRRFVRYRVLTVNILIALPFVLYVTATVASGSPNNNVIASEAGSVSVELPTSLSSTTSSSTTIVFRCCKTSERLYNESHCVKEGARPDWEPVIYSPSLKSLIGFPPDDGWRFKESARPRCQGKGLTYFPSHPEAPANNLLFDNGSLWVQSVTGLIEPGNYCIDPAGCLICLDGDSVPKREGAPKCCGSEAAYKEAEQRCVPSNRPWDLPGNRDGFPVCAEPSFVIAGYLGKTHFLQENGEMIGPGGSPVTKFCLELLDEKPEDGTVVLTCPTSAHGRHRWRHHSDIRFTLYPMGLFLSVFFLAVTLIASCLLPSTYHLLHWRCQTNHVACLLLGDLLLAITQLFGDALIGVPCVSIAIAMHFMFLAAFFWLNTMCFNIWWTFRDLRPTSLDKGQEICRLRMYELYAWGGPLLIAGTAALFHSLPEDAYPVDALLRPKFGQLRCWFSGDTEMFSYFYGPLGILLLVNLTLFGATARELTCGLWKTEVVKSNTERATLGRVCLKLVVVMGVTWVADVISWLVGGPNYVWYLTDVINTLQGVLIFAVVGCQPQVWAAVKRLWCLREMPSEGGGMRSSSSHAMPSVGDQNTTTTSTVKPIETLC